VTFVNDGNQCVSGYLGAASEPNRVVYTHLPIVVSVTLPETLVR